MAQSCAQHFFYQSLSITIDGNRTKRIIFEIKLFTNNMQITSGSAVGSKSVVILIFYEQQQGRKCMRGYESLHFEHKTRLQYSQTFVELK